jgi:hypothetical protein
MATTVRRLGVDDWKLGREIRLRALLDAPEAFYRSYDEEAALDEDTWRGRLETPGRVSLLAELDGRRSAWSAAARPVWTSGMTGPR